MQDIPHFKEVVIMATNCDKCGHRDNEVKSSGGIEEKGRRMELTINTEEDLARDILKVEFIETTLAFFLISDKEHNAVQIEGVFFGTIDIFFTPSQAFTPMQNLLKMKQIFVFSQICLRR